MSKSVQLFERAIFGQSPVDRANHVIRGVKVVGVQSVNAGQLVGMGGDDPYSYSLDALREAIPLYSSCVVRIDHPAFSYDASGERHAANDARQTASVFGRLVNCRVEADGLYADLDYLESHPLAGMITEVAERMPNALALSHHAFANLNRKDGKVVVTKINRVKSVDIIAEKGGTTNGLFESAAEMEQITNEPSDKLLDAFCAKIRVVLASKSGTAVAECKKLIDSYMEIDKAFNGDDSEPEATEPEPADIDETDQSEPSRMGKKPGSPFVESAADVEGFMQSIGKGKPRSTSSRPVWESAMFGEPASTPAEFDFGKPRSRLSGAKFAKSLRSSIAAAVC